MPAPFTLRRRSSSRITPHLESREVEFQVRARPSTPRDRTRSWFTRKNRKHQIVPLDEGIIGTDQIPMASVELSRQNSNSSRNGDYPSIKEINLEELPITDVASEMRIPIADVVGSEGSDCCIPGFSSMQNCRICPERLQPRVRRAENLSRQKEIGGRKRRKSTKRSKKRQLKKRHYSRRRRL